MSLESDAFTVLEGIWVTLVAPVVDRRRNITVFHRPHLTYTLPSRKPGLYGTSVGGQALEWLTATWFRFGALVLWIPLVTIILASPLPAIEKLGLLLVSPIGACVYLLILRGAGFVLLFVPKIGAVIGWLRVGYYLAFSRLVCQQAPDISIPAWFGKSRP